MSSLRKLTMRNCIAALALAITAFASFAVNAADANVAGTWTVSVETQQGTRDSTLTLTQSGAALTGTIKGARGENPVTGTVTGNDIKFTYSVSFNDQSIAIDYAGKVDGSSIAGTVTTPRGENKFTAKKQ